MKNGSALLASTRCLSAVSAAGDVLPGDSRQATRDLDDGTSAAP